jgi:hypothetical protein
MFVMEADGCVRGVRMEAGKKEEIQQPVCMWLPGDEKMQSNGRKEEGNDHAIAESRKPA